MPCRASATTGERRQSRPDVSCSQGCHDLAGVTRLLVVPDGPLHFVPFEALTMPDADDLLVERFEVSYLPSAAFLVRRNAQPDRAWRWPWQRQLVAFGDPPAVSADSSPGAAALPRLSYADDEIRGIAESLAGTVGAAPRRRRPETVSPSGPARRAGLHFSTHAIADTRDPDRSRILLAPSEPGGPVDYLFLREIYDLDLTGVQLVTLSACDTERGRVIRGRGSGRVQPRAARGRRRFGGHDDVGCRRSRQRGVHEAVLRRPCARRVGSVGAATGEAAVPPLRARVVTSALLGRLRAER